MSKLLTFFITKLHYLNILMIALVVWHHFDPFLFEIENYSLKKESSIIQASLCFLMLISIGIVLNYVNYEIEKIDRKNVTELIKRTQSWFVPVLYIPLLWLFLLLFNYNIGVAIFFCSLNFLGSFAYYRLCHTYLDEQVEKSRLREL